MKLCAACCEELPKEKFSNKQWKLKQHQRRCRGCIDEDRAVQLPPPRQPLNKVRSSDECTDDGASCWICLEEGPDEAGQPLRRDCSCRGDAGYIHLSCVAKYAENETNLGKFDAWRVCHHCRQPYRNRLLADLVARFVAYCEEAKVHDILYMRALDRQLRALHGSDDNAIAAEEEITNKILTRYSKMEREGMYSSLPEIQRILAGTYLALGAMSKEKENAERAIEYFEKSKMVSKKLGDTINVSVAERNIASVKAKTLGGDDWSKEKELVIYRCQYQHYCKTFGEESPLTIGSGFQLALALRDPDLNMIIEAERLLSKLVAVSRRVHGRDHADTKRASLLLEVVRQRIVFIDDSAFEALRRNEDGTYIVKGPMINPGRMSPDGKVTTARHDELIILPGTPVVVNCDPTQGEIGEVTGFNPDVPDCYKVRFENETLEPCEVHRDDLGIVFDLPDSRQKAETGTDHDDKEACDQSSL